ncbi:hypothetical protein [Tulasnella ambivirus 3]|uniref:Uncharacterized protein n=1 Tax=Tulasnella ambivirus 3 TaxID=2772291 RepID=A0A7S7YG73_9VIRU|nr:hypothetical protein [Tulasnella ambivirus 3]
MMRIGGLCWLGAWRLTPRPSVHILGILLNEYHFTTLILKCATQSTTQTSIIMLFTSVPAARNTVPPLIFKEHGNTTDMPASLNDTNIIGHLDIVSVKHLVKKEIFFAFLHANATDKRVHLKTGKTPFLSVLDCKHDLILGLPPVCVQKPAATATLKYLEDRAFHQEDFGVTPMMSGHADLDTIVYLSSKGADVTINAPTGKVNIAGWHAANVVNRLIYWSIKSLQEPAFVQGAPSAEGSLWLNQKFDSIGIKGKDSKKMALMSDPDAFAVPHPGEWLIWIDNPDTLPEDASGTFLPYYPGLIHFDSNYMFNTITRLFKYNLGTDSSSADKALRILKTGLPSLGRTSIGLRQSHILFAIDLALNTGCGLALIRDGNGYRGSVMLGQHYKIHKGLAIYEPSGRKELVEELKECMGHDFAIKALCTLLSDTPLNEDESKTAKVEPNEIINPRTLHNLVIKRKMSPEFNSEVTKLVKRLRFDQEYWEINVDNIKAIIEHNSTNTSLPDSAPFPYRTTHLFNRDVITTNLAAFGLKCPMFNPKSGLAIGLVKIAGADAQKRNTKVNEWMKLVSPPIEGIPVYTATLDEARAAWGRLQDTGSIKVIFRGNRIAGNPARVFTKAEGTEVALLLNNTYHAKKAKDTKRKRVDEDDATVEEGRKGKKKSEEDSEALEFAHMFAGESAAAPAHEEMEGLEEEEAWFA